MSMSNTVKLSSGQDINLGLDYEVARERMNFIAGQKWRTYYLAKSRGADTDKLIKLRDDYVDAHQAFKNFRRIKGR
jgi:hypothetical protein